MLVALCILNPHIRPANSTSFPPNAYMRKLFLNYPLYVCQSAGKKISRDKQYQKADLFPVIQESNILKTMFKTGIYFK